MQAFPVEWVTTCASSARAGECYAELFVGCVVLGKFLDPGEPVLFAGSPSLRATGLAFGSTDLITMLPDLWVEPRPRQRVVPGFGRAPDLQQEREPPTHLARRRLACVGVPCPQGHHRLSLPQRQRDGSLS